MSSFVEKFFRGNGLNLGESVVKELVDIDSDPTARVSYGGIKTLSHIDDKGIATNLQQLEKELAKADFVLQRGLDGSKTYKSPNGYVKINGDRVEINVGGKKYNVDMNKFKASDIMKLIGQSTYPSI